MQQFFYEFTKLSFDNLNRHIRLADNKAKFLLSLDLAVISGLSAFALKFFPSLEENPKFTIIVILFSVAILFLMISFFYTVLIITPKSSPKNNPSNLLYWGQIAKKNIDSIQESYWNTSEEDKMKELINQIYFYSKSATDKYEKVKLAVYSMFTALVFLIMTVILSLVLL